jgi:hypothetical protein
MSDGRDRLLPIWLDLGADEIANYAPLLLGRLALKASDGVEEVAARLVSKSAVKGVKTTFTQAAAL